MEQIKLQVEDLTYSIDSKKIIEDIRMSIPKGSFIGIVGPNGCGKSTLLKNIYKVYRPDCGAVYIDGKDLSRISNRESAHEMSVMQQENNMDFDMTVYDMVMLGRYSHQRHFHNTKALDRSIVLDALEEVGMKGYEERSFLSLSGGEKQRTLVARALVQQTPLIILDEPTNHLDIGYQYQIMNILRKQNVTILSSIHDLNIASVYCDHIILMKKGHIVATGTPEEMFTSENIKNLFGVNTQIFINEVTHRPNIVFLPEL